MATMTVEDVVSVLGQLELEVTQREQQQRGLRYIREVLATFSEVNKQCEALKAELATLETKTATLRERYEAKKAKARADLEAHCAQCAKDAETAKAKQAACAHDADEVERRLTERSAEVTAELNALNVKIAEKTTQFDEISRAVTALQQKHGLVAA